MWKDVYTIHSSKSFYVGRWTYFRSIYILGLIFLDCENFLFHKKFEQIIVWHR